MLLPTTMTYCLYSYSQIYRTLFKWKEFLKNQKNSFSVALKRKKKIQHDIKNSNLKMGYTF